MRLGVLCLLGLLFVGIYAESESNSASREDSGSGSESNEVRGRNDDNGHEWKKRKFGGDHDYKWRGKHDWRNKDKDNDDDDSSSEEDDNNSKDRKDSREWREKMHREWKEKMHREWRQKKMMMNRNDWRDNDDSDERGDRKEGREWRREGHEWQKEKHDWRNKDSHEWRKGKEGHDWHGKKFDHESRGKFSKRMPFWKQDEERCSKWQEWEQSKCLWPTQSLESIPKSCRGLPKMDGVPPAIVDYIESKQAEAYSFIQSVFQSRGANEPCGYCSFKVQCRARESGEFKLGCRYKEAQMVPEQCAGTKPCALTPVLGACPAPIPMTKMMHSQQPHFGGHHMMFSHHHMPTHKRMPRNAHHFPRGEMHHGGPHMGPRMGPHMGPHMGAQRKCGRKHGPHMLWMKQMHKMDTGDWMSPFTRGFLPFAHEFGSNDTSLLNNTEINMPLWHCIKSSDGKNCMCCCGFYFPDAKTNTCVDIREQRREMMEEDHEAIAQTIAEITEDDSDADDDNDDNDDNDQDDLSTVAPTAAPTVAPSTTNA